MMRKMIFLLCLWEDATFFSVGVERFLSPPVQGVAFASPPEIIGFPPSKINTVKNMAKATIMSCLRTAEVKESFTNPSLSPPECRRFDDQARPSVTANIENKQKKVWGEKEKLWLHQRI